MVNVKVAAVAVVAAAALSVAGCSSSTTSDAPKNKTMNKDGVSYEYPDSWNEITDLKTGSQTGNQKWQQAVGQTTTNLAIISSYQVGVTVTEQNLAELEPQIVETIGNLAKQSSGTVTSPVKTEQTAGFPGFTAEVAVKSPSGADLQSTLWLFFDGNNEYFLNCQAQAGQQAQMQPGCNTIRQTFKVTQTASASPSPS